LRLEGKLPEQTTTPATLSESVIRLDNYQSLGFRESDKVEGGLYSSGNVDITDTDVKYCICGMGRQYSWKL
jgi:hypothetical protein